ncbi:hypothetical protein [Micromonospora sp. RTGN7]|nr:hypothetical protein [Micromonospora sp. RTGN7]
MSPSSRPLPTTPPSTAAVVRPARGRLSRPFGPSAAPAVTA